MKALTKTAVAASVLLVCNVASASNMYFDLGDNSYDNVFGGTNDADSTTATFNEFGYNQILATSVYDLSDGSVGGSFYDTNVISTLQGLGITSFDKNNPDTFTAVDGLSSVDLYLPTCPGANCDIDALSPLVPPLGTDNEGFLSTWDIQIEYTLNGTLDLIGPTYTGGTMDFYFNDRFNDANDHLFMTATLTGSQLQAADLHLFFDITFAEQGFLYIENAQGDYVDAYDGTQTGNYAQLVLDTNVNPPIPTEDKLAFLTDGDQNPYGVRQATLDGSITASIPEPSTIALLGMGILGFGVRALRRNKA